MPLCMGSPPFNDDLSVDGFDTVGACCAMRSAGYLISMYGPCIHRPWEMQAVQLWETGLAATRGRLDAHVAVLGKQDGRHQLLEH